MDTQNRASSKIANYTSPTPADHQSTPNSAVPNHPSNSHGSSISSADYSPSPVSGAPTIRTAVNTSRNQEQNFTRRTNANFAVKMTTPKKELFSTPGGCELKALGPDHSFEMEQPQKLIKDRYLISAQPSHITAAAAAKTSVSYRHLIDLTSSNLKCKDVITGQKYLCKIINEPLHKVQRAYFQLQNDDEQLIYSSIYGHPLIRGVHDIVPLSKNRTYIIIAPVTPERDSSGIAMGVFENLHTYIRNQKRIDEAEARIIFHQICQTVQVCHRNGIILRDLKLKRFYFIDEARTKLQYESLEGSMILDDPEDDTLSDKIGCPLYTAPELLCPHPTYKGKPADMWSLGVILYTMLVGQYPFYEKANCNLITIIRHGNVHIPTCLSRSVRCLLLALLRKNYAVRLPASHIFLVPWLREQRPFHMYVPVDVVVSDEEDELMNTEEESENIAEVDRICFQEFGVQPLDYTRNTLQMVDTSQQEISTNDTSNDVDMG